MSVPVFNYNWAEILNYSETNFPFSLNKRNEYLKKVEDKISRELKETNRKIEVTDKNKRTIFFSQRIRHLDYSV
jgi:hypothetical protein